MAKKVNADKSLKWKATADVPRRWRKWSAAKFFKTMANLKVEADLEIEALGDKLEIEDGSCYDMYSNCA